MRKTKFKALYGGGEGKGIVIWGEIFKIKKKGIKLYVSDNYSAPC